MKGKLLFAFAAYFGISFCMTTVNRLDGEYASKICTDESCHIPMAELYCNGTYDKWDSRITTGPGLYIFSVASLKILQQVWDIPCSITALRSFNVFVNAFSFLILYTLISHYNSAMEESKRILITFILATFPVHYFYTLLYYTDPLNVFFILLMHLLWVKDKPNYSAIAGLFGVMTRQTTIVWVFYHGLLTIEKVLASGNNNWAYSLSKKDKLEDGWKKYIEHGKSLLLELLPNTVGYLMTGLLFVIFVYVNGGIVLGDRENHVTTFNSPQLLYFALFTGIFSLPHLIVQRKELAYFIKSNKPLVLIITTISSLMVYFNTVAHHYNLGDHHHYTHFWITLLYYNPIIALSFVPIYTVCSLFIIQNSIRSLGSVMSALFILTIALNVIPQLLLEFRYYVPAFLLFSMKISSQQKWAALIYQFVLFTIVNLITIGIFLIRPVMYAEPVTPYPGVPKYCYQNLFW